MSSKTPLMSQYRDIKNSHPDSILLFRVGDFYETFYDDAVDVAGILNIALTTRDKNKPNPIPLAGVPFHAAETYITRLLGAGRKVAVCEQVEDAAQAKGLVRREVVEVLTPGTAINANFLPDEENNYCLSVYPGDGADARVALALIDVSTGEFACGESDLSDIEHLVQGRCITEVIVPPGLDHRALDPFLEAVGMPVVYDAPKGRFDADAAPDVLAAHLGDGPVDLSRGEAAAAGALLQHCMELRGGELPQVVSIHRLAGTAFLELDTETIGNLELFEPQRGNDRKATLVNTVDRTVTPMGAREVRRWLQEPLRDVEQIERRQEAVVALHGNATRLESITRELRGVADIPRLVTRIASRKAIPRELHALRESLERLPALRASIEGTGAAFFERTRDAMGEHTDLANTIDAAIMPDPPGHLREGGVIRRGFDEALDGLIDESEAAKRWIASLEQRERATTGIAQLKVGFNKVFGYYVEVSNAHHGRVPGHYVEKQTLVSARRYYTQELKEKEELILKTEERRAELERAVFERLCATIAGQTHALQETAMAVARVDVLQSLATVAKLHGYVRPVVDDSEVLEIVGGRHAVIERFIDEPFVPNDLHLDPLRRQFGLITGPNMSGKSTFLRQTALIVILAQMGAFVPADRARIGLVDKVFTRVGASDRLSRGESTFLVEMNETANILANMTDRSLVLLDEVGRGTSTYDGLSIAWAVTEYLLQGTRARPRTLFATHFHELTQLRSSYPRLHNLKITIREWEGGIIFLRKIVPGTSDRSFGIHAAKIAGLPEAVLKRAEEILASLELRRDQLTGGVDIAPVTPQYGLFEGRAPAAPDSTAPAEKTGDPEEKPHDLHDALASFDLEKATPLDAFDFLRRLKDRL